MAQDDAAFASFEHKWLHANPEQATVAVFLEPAARRRAAAFGSFVHELEQAAFGMHEAQVAAVKLNWWRQELAAAAAGTARHPIARELFDDERARAIDDSLWSALIDGALAQLDMGAASTLQESFDRLGVFFRPAAALDAALSAGNPLRDDANARLWISSHMLRSAAVHPEHERTLPLDLLARHGLARSSLAGPGPQRAAVLRDFLGLLHAEIDAALAHASRASLGRRVRARLDRELMVKARAAADPAMILAEHAQVRRWRSLWLSWREARRLARGNS